MGDFPLLNFNKPNLITTFAYMYDKIYFLSKSKKMFITRCYSNALKYY